MTKDRQPLARDLEVVRGLLIYISQAGNETMPTSQPVSDKYTPELISYHLKIMHDHGLFEGNRYDNGSWGLYNLTWEVQDFLTAAQNDTVWNKAKEQAGDTFGALTLNMAKELLNRVIRGEVGLG